MEFGEVMADQNQRRRLLSLFVLVLFVAVLSAAFGLSKDWPALTIFSGVIFAGCVGFMGKVSMSTVIKARQTSDWLRVLNDRYEDTERWLEQFDQGTRATFVSMSQSQAELGKTAQTLSGRIDELKELVSDLKTTLATREALDAVSKKVASATSKAEEAIESLDTGLEKLEESQAKIGKKIEHAVTQAAETTRDLRQLQEADERLETAIESNHEEVQAIQTKLTNKINTDVSKQDRLRRSGLHEIRTESTEHVEREIAAADTRIGKLSKIIDTVASLSSRQRGDGYVQFPRLIGGQFTKEVQGEIGQKLGISIKPGELRYLERKIQQIEAASEGRLATTSEDAVARVLAARSCKGQELRVLEIGVLFGVGAVFMHTALAPFYKRVNLVLLDPFDGYYGPEHLDPLTGQIVSRAAVERNIRRSAIRDEDVTILEGFSTDDSLLKRAKQAGPYDVIVIDGDHSYEGVKADFERYAGFITDGGILIVDDYGSDDWPEVTKYVDDVVSHDGRFEQVGVLSRTAIFKRTAVSAKASKSISKDEGVPVKGKTQAGSADKPKAVSKKASSKRATKKKASKKASSKKSSPKTARKEPLPLAQEIAGHASTSESVPESVE